MELTPFQELNMSDVQMLITAIHSLDEPWRTELRDKLDRMQENLLKHDVVWVAIDPKD